MATPLAATVLALALLPSAAGTLPQAQPARPAQPATAGPEARLAQHLLERAQAREELELLLAEAMWGPVARAAYQPLRVTIAVNGRQRPALLDPSGATPPRWLDEPPGSPAVHY